MREYTHLVGTVGHQAAVDLSVFEILVLLAVPSDGLGAARQQTYECRFARCRLQQIVHIQRCAVLASFRKKEYIHNFLMQIISNRVGKQQEFQKDLLEKKNSSYFTDRFR